MLALLNAAAEVCGCWMWRAKREECAWSVDADVFSRRRAGRVYEAGEADGPAKHGSEMLGGDGRDAAAGSHSSVGDVDSMTVSRRPCSRPATNSSKSSGSTLTRKLRYPKSSRSIWLTSRKLKRPCPTMVQLLFEYVSSQEDLLASIKAEMKRRWPEDPRAAGKRHLRRLNRYNAWCVTASGSLVRWRA